MSQLFARPKANITQSLFPMAKTVVDEKIRFSLEINGNKAQKELYDLEKSTRDLTARNKELKAERAKLYRQGKRGSAEYKNLSAEIKKNSETLRGNKNRMKALQDEIGLTGLTMNQLRKRASRLRLQLQNMVPGSAKYNKLQAELKQTSARMQELRGASRNAGRGLGGLADRFNRFAALGASVVATLTGVVFSIQQMIDYNGKLSDAQADVMKTTGMTKTEVDELAKSFGLLKTRTSRINLLKIAEEGGRIGIVKEEIGDFVEVMNKATVALSDSFPGGVEEVASKLGKLKTLFKETKEQGVEEAYNAIGSSLNELGANGVATEANIADFATRVGSLPEAVKPSIQQALALGAAFEESGIKSEIASRGYNIAVKAAAANADKFAKVMNMTTGQVESLINKDPLEFMIKFAKGMKGMDATQTAKTLKYLGINADGTNKILGALSNNTERFAEMQNISNVAMAEATSLTDEYEIKNNNLAATIDKVSKRFRGLFTSDMVVNFLKSGVEWFGKFIGATEDTTGGVTRFREALFFLVKVLAIITASVLSYNAAVKLSALLTTNAYQATKLYTLAQKVSATTTRGLTAATLLGKVAFFGLTGQIKKARVALRLLNITAKVSPIGIIVGIIGAATAAYIAFSEEAEKAATTQDFVNKAMAEGRKKTAGTAEKLRVLQSVVEDETASEEARKKAMEQINKIVPDYNKNLDLSQEALNNGRKAIDKYVESLQKQAEAQFLADQVSIKSKELRKQEDADLRTHISWYEQLWNATKSLGSIQEFTLANSKTMMKNRKESIELTKKELEAAKEAYKAYIETNPDATVTESEYVTNFTAVGDTTDSGGGSTDSQAKYNLQKEQEELLRLQRENAQARTELTQEEYLRELEQLDLQHEKKIERIKANLVGEAELKALQKDIDKARAGGNEDTARDYEQILKIWQDKNAEVKARLLDEEQIYQNKIGTIIANGQENRIEDLQAAFERERSIRETEFNNQLAAISNLHQAKQQLKETLSQEELDQITSLEQAKQALRDEFNRQESQKEQEHLQNLIAKMEEMFASGEFEGFDLDLLPEDQKQDMLQRLEELRLALSKLKAEKDGIAGGGNENQEGGGILADTGRADIFGMTPDDWTQMQTNIEAGIVSINDMANAVNILGQTWRAYSDYRKAEEDRRYQAFEENNNAEIRKQKRKLDLGLINERQYNRAVEQLEREKERKKAELEYKQAKRDKAMAIAEATSSTALAVLNALGSVPFPANLVAAALMTTMGGLQIATIAKQPLPARGFEDGFYPVEREQDGKLFNARYGGQSRTGVVDSPTLFLAGERGKDAPEMIINGTDYSNFAPEFKESLHREVARVKGYEQGFYPTETKADNFNNQDTTANADTMALAEALNRNSEILEYYKENPLQAYLVRNQRMAKELQEDIEKYNQTRNNARR